MTDTSNTHAEIDESITETQEMTGFQAAIRTQPFWVFVAIIGIGVVMSFVSDVFLTERNFFNITLNFAFFGIMALGMSAVICTAGIDLSVGSLMGLTGIVTGLVMQAGYGIGAGFLACMGAAATVGFINGVFRIDPMVDRLHRVLDLRTEQHALTSSNLANAETPGYRARVIDFTSALADAMGEGSAASRRLADLGLTPPGGTADRPEILEIEPPPFSEDDNSVYAERETSRMVANQVVYSGVTAGLSRHLAMLRFAASDGRA